MLKDLFSKKRKKHPDQSKKKEVPEGLMAKCPDCGTIFYIKELRKNDMVCENCGYHHRITAGERLHCTIDEGSFEEFDQGMIAEDPLQFPEYKEKSAADREKSNLNEAIVTGKASVEGVPVVIGVMDARFRMGSMGSVVGEKIARAVDRAIEARLPVILFSASGGARMQEGVVSLMQMAKTSAALKRLDEAGLLFISVMTHPTTGGVSASFASLGDVNLAEPRALIGFAGRRIIEQTIREKLPDDFQTSEFLMEHGQLDQVVHRHDMRRTIAILLAVHHPAAKEETT
ncbi:acetyl-CoA carboxylase, carboxyltransferase subunit beta [Alkalicoccus chagannorensis]|uniref:acetyl-CoA carboxylase, carboxyltransferase subunit beta n=1 Tax=Alkalicoccus chagannorensis TaxID=427072 RepID=UPI00041664AA|nr:acetyl-CoA carboxylase, carboxyltransferase subunit beta [Alkalicoccus chagannorensis]